MKVWLQEMKWEEVRDHLQKDDVVIIPVGSTEQHGTHLPLGTDSMVAIALAEDAAKEAGALVAPPIWFGWSPHHMAYPGTITIRPETLIELIMDVCRSLIYHGFHRVIVLNGHRVANMAPLTIAATTLREQTGAYVVVESLLPHRPWPPPTFKREQAFKWRTPSSSGIGSAVR